MRLKKKTLNILGISHYSVANNRGGGEVMFHEILVALKENGHNVSMISTMPNDEKIIIDGIEIYRGEKYRNQNLSKFDIVITQFEEAYKNIDNIKKFKKKIVYVVHNDMYQTKEFIKKYSPDLVIYNTEWIKSEFEFDGIVVHPPVNVEKYKTTPGEMITLVNLTPAKGSNMFYNMAFRLPQFRFFGVEGGYFKNQQQFIRRPNISFIMNTPNMKEEVYSKTKVLLMPSTYETYGMVGIEAMASGIPVVATRTPGLEESLSYAGIFPKDTKISTWRNEIINLMTNSTYYKEKSELAKKRAQEIEDNRQSELDNMVKEIEKLV